MFQFYSAAEIKKKKSIYIYINKDGDSIYFIRLLGFPGGSDGEESACNAGDGV